MLAGIRGSEKPVIKWHVWKLWIFCVVWTGLDMLDEWVGLPIQEGYWPTFSLLTISLVFSIPLLWMLKPTLWFSFNISSYQAAIECVFLWVVFIGLAYFGLLLSPPIIINQLTEEKAVAVIDEYHVEWYERCESRGGNVGSCVEVEGYYLFLGDEKSKIKYRINKSSYNWLRYNYSQVKEVKNRMTRVYDRTNPIALTYKPEAEIVLSITPYKSQS